MWLALAYLRSCSANPHKSWLSGKCACEVGTECLRHLCTVLEKRISFQNSYSPVDDNALDVHFYSSLNHSCIEALSAWSLRSSSSHRSSCRTSLIPFCMFLSQSQGGAISFSSIPTSSQIGSSTSIANRLTRSMD